MSDDHGPTETEFTGRVKWVQIDLGEDAEDADHLITAGGAPEGRNGEAIAAGVRLALFNT